MATFNELFGKNLDENIQEQTGDFQPVPKGRYTLSIEDVDDNRISSSGKRAIGIKYRIVGPSHANRIVFEDLYVQGVSEKCASVSFSKLSRISKCAFGKAVESTGELVGGVLDADVDIDAQPGYKPRNRVSRYYPATEGSQKAKDVPAPAPKADEPMPWEF